MDPSRVDGLARVLETTATTHQVIVFTHDDRLPESVRRLQIPATVIEVTRRPWSVVELREVRGPVESYISDVWALAKTDELPQKVLRRVVPGFCRLAVEAACIEVIRRRRLSRGDPHGSVEELLTDADKTNKLVALALFDDMNRGEDVLPKLNSWNPRFATVLKQLNRGAHEPIEGEFGHLVNDARDLARRIQELP